MHGVNGTPGRICPPDNHVLAVDHILRVIIPNRAEVKGLGVNPRRPAGRTRSPSGMADAAHHAFHAVVQQIEVTGVFIETDGQGIAVFLLDSQNLLGDDVKGIRPADALPSATAPF